MLLTGSVTARGAWPGVVVLRSGWSKAVGRPWNDDLADAALRLERGSAGFLRAAARWLFESGAPAAISAPLHASTRGVWDKAGFDEYLTLRLLERRLAGTLEPGTHPVRPARASDWPGVIEVDRSAFPPRWRIGRLGLADALSATPRSRLLVAGEPTPAGFVIVGVAGSTGYVQRIAVDPARQARGVGRALLRQAIRWAHQRTAHTMLLNTQTDNERAVALYESEGFQMLPDTLVMLRATPSQ